MDSFHLVSCVQQVDDAQSHNMKHENWFQQDSIIIHVAGMQFISVWV